MAFQYTQAGWTARQAQLNAAAGSSISLSLAVVNAVIAAAADDEELARIARSNFDNLVSLRLALHTRNPADAAIAALTTVLNGMVTRWPTTVPAVPVLN